jgi:predicted nucleic acid-binding protein
VSVAYLDTSCLVALAFDEPEARRVRAALEEQSQLLSSGLLEAELLSTLALEGVSADPHFLGAIGWVLPDRPLGPEIRRALAHGYAKGADLWHLATALYVAEDPSELTFLTLDPDQRQIALALGFRVA